ncbi:hypothetical protein [Inquilinus sp. Marseille-Q2685]|uniref:hypothetical protein n=1 Tax=Inquilinus sp. Marseille-Q2685 TaxID=2866581 RepID=UPI001CE3FE4B|nr:hypothetical protein [Inquilinus sp. Marseille-Q2685]
MGERIHTVWDFWDAPREGVADFQGRPHIYKCQFSEAEDDWTNLFWLMEIDQELLALDLERSAISARWLEELKRGRVSPESGPALPIDRPRFQELQSVIGDRLQLRPERSVIRRGRFVASPGANSTMVEWTEP